MVWIVLTTFTYKYSSLLLDDLYLLYKVMVII